MSDPIKLDFSGGITQSISIPVGEYNALCMDKYRMDALIRMNNDKLLNMGEEPKWSREHIDKLLKK